MNRFIGSFAHDSCHAVGTSFDLRCGVGWENRRCGGGGGRQGGGVHTSCYSSG